MTDYGAENRAYMDRLKDDPEHVARAAEFWAALDALPDVPDPIDPALCTEVHREPKGPNEDLAQCPVCWSITFAMRPEGETFGWHADDCALPMRHQGYCQHGGTGHIIPANEKIRGYFGPDWVEPPRAPASRDVET